MRIENLGKKFKIISLKVILLLFKKNIFYKFRYDTFGTSKILFIFLYLLGQNRIFHWKSPKSPHYFEIRQYRQFLGLKIAEIRHLAIYRQPKISIATERPKIADLAIYRQTWQHWRKRKETYVTPEFVWNFALVT